MAAQLAHRDCNKANKRVRLEADPRSLALLPECVRNSVLGMLPQSDFAAARGMCTTWQNGKQLRRSATFKLVPPGGLANVLVCDLVPKELHDLNLIGAAAFDDQLAALRFVPNLEKLFVVGGVTDACVPHIVGNLHQLQELVLGGKQLTSAGIAPLASLTKLRKLKLSANTYTGDMLAELPPTIEILDLMVYNSVTNDSVAHLLSLHQLRCLDLSHCKMLSTAGLAILAQISTLRTLRLQSCAGVDTAGIEALANHNELRKLDLSFCNISDADLVHIGHMTSLVVLRLHGCWRMTDRGIEQLHGLLALRMLDLHWCGLSYVTAWNAGLRIFI